MKNHRPSAFRKYLLFSLAGSFVLALAVISGAAASSTDTYKSLEVFSNVLSLIQKNYVEDVDTNEVLQGAIKGMPPPTLAS